MYNPPNKYRRIIQCLINTGGLYMYSSWRYIDVYSGLTHCIHLYIDCQEESMYTMDTLRLFLLTSIHPFSWGKPHENIYSHGAYIVLIMCQEEQMYWCIQWTQYIYSSRTYALQHGVGPVGKLVFPRDGKTRDGKTYTAPVWEWRANSCYALTIMGKLVFASRVFPSSSMHSTSFRIIVQLVIPSFSMHNLITYIGSIKLQALSQNIVSFVGLFCKRDLWFNRSY